MYVLFFFRRPHPAASPPQKRQKTCFFFWSIGPGYKNMLQTKVSIGVEHSHHTQSFNTWVSSVVSSLQRFAGFLVVALDLGRKHHVKQRKGPSTKEIVARRQRQRQRQKREARLLTVIPDGELSQSLTHPKWLCRTLWSLSLSLYYKYFFLLVDDFFWHTHTRTTLWK